MHRPVRTSLLVLTAVTAIAMSVVTIASYIQPFSVSLPTNDRTWVMAHWYDGQIRVFWIGSAERSITIEHDTESPQPQLVIRSEGPMEFNDDPFTSSNLPKRPNFKITIAIGSRSTEPAFGFSQPWKRAPISSMEPNVAVHEFRFPFWLPVVILVIITLECVRRGPMRRRHRLRRGLCLDCGYDLRGLPEPRCPECGAPIAAEKCQPIGTSDEQVT